METITVVTHARDSFDRWVGVSTIALAIVTVLMFLEAQRSNRRETLGPKYELLLHSMKDINNKLKSWANIFKSEIDPVSVGAGIDFSILDSYFDKVSDLNASMNFYAPYSIRIPVKEWESLAVKYLQSYKSFKPSLTVFNGSHTIPLNVAAKIDRELTSYLGEMAALCIQVETRIKNDLMFFSFIYRWGAFLARLPHVTKVAFSR